MSELEKLGPTTKYLIKPTDGCDSQGLKVLLKEQLLQHDLENFVVQPLIEFEYEVSFYFIGNKFQYALYTPNQNRRWELKVYSPGKEDLAFAEKFINWSSCTRGIQRIDACRDSKGNLLLMELEDYNPFLSFEVLNNQIKTKFMSALTDEITNFIECGPRA